jgi:WD40 repeat protein
MAQVWRHLGAIAAALAAFAALIFAPALAQDQGPNNGTDLYDRPVLAVDPGMHSAKIWSLAVAANGHIAVTGSDDRTLRIWSVADGTLLRTIWLPAGPENIGRAYAVAISPDGATIAAGGWTETRAPGYPIYLFDPETGNLVRRIYDAFPDVTFSLTFSPDGRYLVATLAGSNGLRVFDRNKNWSEVFRDDKYKGSSYDATFARDGHFATTSDDGSLRLYRFDPNSNSPNFRRVGEPIKVPSGKRPSGVAYSPDGKLLAVGYRDVGAVDIFDGRSLERVGGHRPAEVDAQVGPERVAWSPDGQTLFAAGGVSDAQVHYLLFAWDRGGLGNEKRMTYCIPSRVAGLNALPDGRILVATMTPCLGLMDAAGRRNWTVASRLFDFRSQESTLKASVDGSIVDFVYSDPNSAIISSADLKLRFDLRSLALSSPAPSDGLTLAPLREGLTIEGWRDGTSPTLDARPIALQLGEIARSVAITADAKRFFLASSFALTAFDDSGKSRWRLSGREVWAVNASRDGRVVVAAGSDGTIRWHRADDGRELLALQVIPNAKEPAKWDWVLWTPEGFYEATPGAEDVLRWVVNHGPDKAATTLPVSAIAKLHRPNTLPLVLQQLETARAIGIDEITQARLDVQAKTGSAKPPGGVLHVLAIGVDKFGDKAAGLHLEYAAEDAHDVATALLDSQKGPPGKASLYADVSLTSLRNEKADSAAILDALEAMAQSVAKSGPGLDIAVILVSSHGEMIDGQFYLIPYGFDAGSQGRSIKSAVSASEFAKKVAAIAVHAKVLLLLDACHSGAVGAQGWATNPDAKVLQDAMNLENVSVLTSSKQNELSEELPGWKHGALTQAFLDALVGAADSQGIVRLSAMTDAMEHEIKSLTNDRQHLGMHINFSADLFTAGHY